MESPTQMQLDKWMSLREVFRARLSACSENGWVLQTPDGYGLKPSDCLASLDHGSPYLKIRQRFLAMMEDEPGTPSPVDWPRSGMIVSGKLFALPSLVPAIYGRDCASSLPTPIANDANGSGYCYGKNKEILPKLPGAVGAAYLPTPRASVAMLPTPASRDWKDTPGMKLETEDRSRNDQLPRRRFGELLPTPNAKPDKSSWEAREAREAKGQKVSSTTQHAIESLLPTPTSGANHRTQYAQGGKSTLCAISEAAPVTRSGGMRLTPAFLCWLQGFPIDWLKPLVDASEIQSFRKRGCQSRKPSPPS